jgi:hypothetical protein
MTEFITIVNMDEMRNETATATAATRQKQMHCSFCGSVQHIVKNCNSETFHDIITRFNSFDNAAAKQWVKTVSVRYLKPIAVHLKISVTNKREILRGVLGVLANRTELVEETARFDVNILESQRLLNERLRENFQTTRGQGAVKRPLVVRSLFAEFDKEEEMRQKQKVQEEKIKEEMRFEKEKIEKKSKEFNNMLKQHRNRIRNAYFDREASLLEQQIFFDVDNITNAFLSTYIQENYNRILGGAREVLRRQIESERNTIHLFHRMNLLEKEETQENYNKCECPICYDTVGFNVKTSCGHTFCGDCINHYIVKNTNNAVLHCPMCRSDIATLESNNKMEYSRLRHILIV